MRKLKITELNRLTTEAYKEAEKIPLVVVLDNVRSLHNVGSVFRTSDAFRLQAVYLCGITATPPHAEIHKTALGAEFSVDWKYFEHTADAIQALKTAGFRIAAVEQAENSQAMSDFRTCQQAWAIVLGNEVHGVEQSVMDMCETCIEIPQYGTKHSLNVSVTAGIVIWELFKQYDKH
ncbi:MAG: RNA methyltransferase [Candidatus Symbiothrix sp.]|nr:RNA methyltransferase [Candidatus Symbiothrix sp.]